MWYKQISNDSDVVISTRLRFARNIDGYKFPHIMNKQELEKVVCDIENVIDRKEYKLFRIKDIDKVTLGSLFENHVISKELQKNLNSAIVTNDDNTIIAMINEEDHLRIQSFDSGFNIDKCYQRLMKFNDMIEKKITFAINDRYGYLTSCPTNVGSGMRVSIMLHLPALSKSGILTNLFDQVINMGLSVRGYYGENTSGGGDIYQISNQKTLGVYDEDIINNVKNIVTSIIEQERKAREILKNTSIYLEDEEYRAYGILKNARSIDEEEALNLLSKLRLGVSIGIVKEIDLKKVQSLINDIGTNTLKTILKEDFPKKEEDLKRAEYIRKELI